MDRAAGDPSGPGVTAWAATWLTPAAALASLEARLEPEAPTRNALPRFWMISA